MLTLSRLISAATLLAASAACVPVASAQVPRIAISSDSLNNKPTVPASALPAYAKLLALDGTQAEAFKTLQEAYSERLAASHRAMTEALRAVGDDAADFKAAARKLTEINKKYGGEQNKLTQELLDDLKGLLTPAQVEKWPALERLRRRAASMGGEAGGVGIVSGAATDLIELIDRLALPAEESAKVSPILAEYDLEMDLILREKEAAQKQRVEAMERENGKEGVVMTLEGMRTILDQIRERELKQRDANTRFLDRILAVVSPESKAKVEARWKLAAFSEIYGTSHAQRQLKAAAKLQDLTAEQLAKIEAMKSSYEADAVSLNELWMKAKIDADKTGKGVYGILASDVPEENRLARTRKSRRDRDQRVADELKALLGEELFTKLPKRDRKGPVGPDGEVVDLPTGIEGVPGDVEEIRPGHSGGGGGGS